MHDRWVRMVHVTFKDNTCNNLQLNVYQGACLVGDPTAYVYRNGELVWVKLDPNKNLGWVEV